MRKLLQYLKEFLRYLNIRKSLVFRQHYIFCISKNKEISLANDNLKDIEIAQVNHVNLREIEKVSDKGRLLTFQQFLNDEYIGVYAYFKGEAVGYFWSKPCVKNRIRILNYFNLIPGEALVLYGRVHQDYRGKRIFELMLKEIALLNFKDNDIQTVYGDVSVDNIPSIISFLRAGYHFYGLGVFINYRRFLLYRKIKVFRKL